MGGADIRNPGRHRGDVWLAWDMSDRKELEQQRLEAPLLVDLRRGNLRAWL